MNSFDAAAYVARLRREGLVTIRGDEPASKPDGGPKEGTRRGGRRKKQPGGWGLPPRWIRAGMALTNPQPPEAESRKESR